MRKAKIVDTIGPSTEDYDNLLKLVEAGMDVARLNRSHGTPEDHLKVYNNVRKASEATGRNVAALVDLQGPKIRCGWFKKNADGEDKVQLTEGQEFVITTDDIEGDEHITSTTFKGLPGDCHPGDPILIDDGKVRLEVTKVEGNNVYTKVVVAGPVSSHKGINLPGVAVSLPALTEKDEADLRWAIRTGADIIAMSFVRFATDIDRAHEIMDEEGRRIPIIAKIEKPQALENLEEIVKTFDGVMAARGDMAVECPLEEVPLATKRIIELARQYAKPVIVATEVLGSMVNSPVPTRAEASDCANAILDGADAVMLGAPLARATEAPGKGTHWGSEARHQTLPRGYRTTVGTVGPLEQVLFGPSHQADGKTNFIGALKRAMASTGYVDVKNFQRCGMVVNPYSAR